ncbi:MAG: sn-glycerol-3-phosphate ABC transporter ATP-binding protein UgpC [Pseudomonadota bacterium]
MADVSIQNLGKSFGDVEILKDINLDVNDGEFVVLVGPSGCGKSTLLRSVAGLEPVTNGTISIKGRRVETLTPAKRGIAMVFQSYALYPHVDVYGNMAFGLKFAGTPKAEIDQRVRDAARMLRLESLLKRKPRELSGGQRQRVAIGRAIVREPDVFLFDEPLSNLDAALRVATRIEIAKLHKLLKATIIYVTHDQVEAMTLADRIVVMNEGRIEQTGKPLDLYYRPRNKFVAGFIGSPSMNFFSGTALVQGDSVSVRTEAGDVFTMQHKVHAEKDTHVTIGIRPEHLSFDENGPIKLKAKVDYVERLGETGFAYARLGNGEHITLQITGDKVPQPGESITLSAASQNVHLFGHDGLNLAS